MTPKRWLLLAEAALVCCASAYLLYIYPWPELLRATVTAGGDTASHYYPAVLMRDELLPRGQLTGWTMGNYAGFPIFHFYSTLPFAVIALLGYVFPMQVVFKLVSLLGPTTLPLAAGYLFRSLGYGRSASVIAAGSVLPFLFQQGNSMWGGNIPSVLAGEFCHSIGLSLSFLFLGLLHRTANGKGSWTGCGFLLAAIGLSHAFAFIGALWFSLFYLWPRREVTKYARMLVPVYLLAFLLLCFWGLPLVPRVQFTTEWSVIWRIKQWQEVIPELLWPAGILAIANTALMAVRIKRFSVETHGLMLFVLFGAGVLYLLAPGVGFPDIRFIPLGQIMLGFLAADLLAWAGSRLRFQLLYGAVVLAATLAWSHQHIGYLPSWLKWNYSGYEAKVTWSLFKEINDHVRGDINSPRMIFEHSQMHNRFGSSRAFENLPFFAGRSTLEGVFHQVSPNSPFVFYIQSEASERTSGPFPQYTYMRLNLDDALPHLRLYNVGTVVASTQKGREAYHQHPDFERTFFKGSYAVYEVNGGNTGYVVAAANEPVLYTGPDYKTAFYRWFKHHDLLDIPLVPESIIGEGAGRKFALRTDSVTRLERKPYEGECEVSTRLEHQRITFDTTCPGRPHIVKVSYFPRWQAADGSPVHLVSPGFMLVYPQGSHFELSYERTPLDWIALSLTWLGLLWAAACIASKKVSSASVETLVALTGPVFAIMERRRLILSVALFAALALAGAAMRVALTRPDTLYAQGQEAYKAREFEHAVRLLEDWTATDRETFKQATAIYQLGVSHSELGNHAASVQVHERLRFEFPNINYGAGTLYHLAKNYAALDMTDKARAAAVELEKNFADNHWVKRLRREQPDLLPPLPEQDQPAVQPSAARPQPGQLRGRQMQARRAQAQAAQAKAAETDQKEPSQEESESARPEQSKP